MAATEQVFTPAVLPGLPAAGTPGIHDVTKPLSFGPAAVLKPQPPRLPDWPHTAMEHVPDTAIDWLDTEVGHVRAVSARGHMHRYLGEVRQDSYGLGLVEDVLVISVADGLGSAEWSHMGSAVASAEAARWKGFLELTCGDAAPFETVSMEALAEELAAVAADRGVDVREVATTLVAAAVRTRQMSEQGIAFEVTLLQVGDSTAWRCSSEEGGWVKLGEEPDDRSTLISTAVDPLPLHHEARVWRETFEAGETLALVSDGVGNMFQANSDYASVLAGLWQDGAPTPSRLLEVVDATVKSFDDDRTFVGIHFPGPAQS
ncbi:protein phosphatase 2C domain-containing protein [Nocardioides sp. WL0053]|uniref:Protein phosphatase 2C domain-containing protein n=1 Tax=Nocardioides jiangsuensis TaxID=2866161 RepID=A0ABS7RLM3_9ACTN|nr:protein phosphatase 2C domain-containing protein [Nocardioides jiangsuensis]MBY9075962.1 protein phosphatase 2C domain-containing protein [Nocardioides jiangsuensis]